MARRALILFAHGARDPRWAEPFQRLRDIIRQQAPELTVELAFLELMVPRLPELARQLVDGGHDALRVVPVFFGQGGHLLRDFPVLIEQLRQAHPATKIEVAGAVGEDGEVLQAIARYCIGSITRT